MNNFIRRSHNKRSSAQVYYSPSSNHSQMVSPLHSSLLLCNLPSSAEDARNRMDSVSTSHSFFILLNKYLFIYSPPLSSVFFIVFHSTTPSFPFESFTVYVGVFLTKGRDHHPCHPSICRIASLKSFQLVPSTSQQPHHGPDQVSHPLHSIPTVPPLIHCHLPQPLYSFIHSQFRCRPPPLGHHRRRFQRLLVGRCVAGL